MQSQSRLRHFAKLSWGLRKITKISLRIATVRVETNQGFPAHKVAVLPDTRS